MMRTSTSHMIKNQVQISTLYFELFEETIKINVKSLISMQEMVSLVKEVAQKTFVDDIDFQYAEKKESGFSIAYEKNCIFAPYYKNIAFSQSILSYYTDASAFFCNADDLYFIISSTDLMMEIYSKINSNQLFEIENAIKELIEFRKLEILSQERMQLNRILSKIQEINQLLKEWDDLNISEVVAHLKKLANHHET